MEKEIFKISNNGNDLGRLFIKDDQILFEGNVDESAKIFFDSISNNMEDVILERVSQIGIKIIQDKISNIIDTN